MRAFLNPVAGILGMPAGRLRDTIGSANIDKYLLPAVALIVVVSRLPIAVEVIRT